VVEISLPDRETPLACIVAPLADKDRFDLIVATNILGSVRLLDHRSPSAKVVSRTKPRSKRTVE
jgi:hypothetical protein